MSGKSPHAPPGRIREREPSDGIRNILRWMFLPFVIVVAVPFFVAFTLAMGCIAVIIALISPRVAFHCGTFWAWVECRVNFIPVTFLGRQRADPNRSYVIMSNHQSHFDVLAFYGHWGRQFRWVMKESLRKMPGLGWYCSAGGHIFIDRSSRQKAIQSLRDAEPLLVGGVSVMIFPEGSRSQDGRIGKFMKGGFMMALDMGLPILPISISGTRHVLPSGSMRMLPSRIKIQVQEPIDPADYGHDRRDELMADVKAAIMKDLSPWERGEIEGEPVK